MHFTAGNILRERLRLDEAAAEFQQAISLDPTSPRLTATSAICCSSATISRAHSVYEKALAIKPDFEIHSILAGPTNHCDALTMQ